MSASGALFDVRLWARALGATIGAGVVAPTRPDRLARMALRGVRSGTGLASLVTIGAARHPGRVALVDERGALTYEQLDDRVAVIAVALRERFDVGPERPLAVMCRNHRGFLEAMAAGSRLGADLLLLNTDFPAPQLAQVLERESPAVVVCDAEFAGAFDEAGFDGPRVVAWPDEQRRAVTLDALVEGDSVGGPLSRRQGRVVILTSGTTGTPKGAPRRPELRALVGPATTILSNVPLRARDAMLVAPPFFHGFGLAYLGLCLFLGGTAVMRRRFDAEAALAAIDEHGVAALIGVPVMLERIVTAAERSDHGGSDTLRVAVSGAAPLLPALASRFMDRFGDILYNLYGSTETGFGAIASPADLRAAAGTVGRPPFGTTLKIVRDDGQEAEPGEPGRIFVGGALVFEGYTGGGGKEQADGLTSTGDVGHLDEKGRLFIDGREDDMIVSGGENVFPKEVETVLAEHDDVADVAVIGTDDAEFGQRLQAFVVARPGAPTSEECLKQYVRAQLARYKVPREIVFVDDLERNPTGKVNASRLRSRD